MKPNKLQGLQQFIFTNVKALQAFHLMRQGAIIVVAILFAKQLPSDIIGNYEQLLYIGYTVSFFWVAGLIQGLLTTYPDYSSVEKGRLLWNTYLSFVGVGVLLFVPLLLFKDAIIGILTQKESLDYYTLFLVYLLINMPTYLVENFYLLKNQAAKIFTFGFFSFFGHVLVLMVPIWLGYPFRYSMIGLVLLASLKHLWLWTILYQVPKQFDRKMIGAWFSLSFPLMLYALLGGLMQTFDNWLINFWYQGDSEKFAIFRYGARELPLVLALAAAFGTAMLPEIRKNKEQALKDIKSKSRQLFHALFPLSILLLATSQYWFTWVFSEAFEESIIVFNAYLLIITSRLIFSRTLLIGLKDNRTVLYISLIELVVNIVLSFLLIAEYGLLGVALATVIAYFIEKVLISWYVFWKYKISLQQYTSIYWWAGYSLVLVIVFLFQV